MSRRDFQTERRCLINLAITNIKNALVLARAFRQGRDMGFSVDHKPTIKAINVSIGASLSILKGNNI